MWNAATSSVSRFQSSFWPLALKVIPAILSREFFGECPPGTHIGYSRVNGPACTGMVCLIRKMRWARLVASTSILIVPGYGTSRGGGISCADAFEASRDARARHSRLGRNIGNSGFGQSPNATRLLSPRDCRKAWTLG